MILNEKDLDEVSGGGTSKDGTKCKIKCGKIVRNCSAPNHQKVGESYIEREGTTGGPGFIEWGPYQDYICLNCGVMWTEEI